MGKCPYCGREFPDSEVGQICPEDGFVILSEENMKKLSGGRNPFQTFLIVLLVVFVVVIVILIIAPGVVTSLFK